MTHQIPLRAVYAIALVLSACSLTYELLIAQSLSVLAANMVVWYSVTVGVYLAAMGIGALIYHSWPPKDHWNTLFWVEISLSVVGALAVPLVSLGHTAFLFLSELGHTRIDNPVFFAVSFSVVFLVGLLSGIELPLLIRVGNDASIHRPVSNRVLGWDYLGALVAGVAFPVFLVPHLELLVIGLFTATLNLAVAALVVLRFAPATPGPPYRAGACGALSMVFLVGYLNSEAVEQYFLKKYYYYVELETELFRYLSPLSDLPDIFRASSAYQKIDIVHIPGDPEVLLNAYSTKLIEDPSYPQDYHLFLNGDYQLGSTDEHVYHEYFAHVPVIAQGKVPERVLVMGGGDGLLIKELLKYEQVQKITHVDLDPKLISLANTHPILTRMNDHALEDPRVSTLFGDAYDYIRNATERYDAIYLDFPYAMDYNLSRLYSREFFHFVRQHLTADGYAALDAPDSAEFIGPGAERISPNSDWPIYYNTLKQAGFGAIIPYVSELEPDNPTATAIVRAQLKTASDAADHGSPTAESAQVQEYMHSWVKSAREGFILVREKPGAAPPKYRDFGVKLHVLNQDRFHRALALPFPTPDGIDATQVNSILRPTLPTISTLYTRSAW